jgi:hypothetical protein
MLIPYKHSEIVNKAFEWAKGRHLIVMKERVAGWGEIPDVLAINLSISTLIECKVSRADFYRDKKKYSRSNGDMLGTHRLYCCPRGLLSENDLPEGWGLLEVYPSGFTRLKSNVYKSYGHNMDIGGFKGERHALVTAIRDYFSPEMNKGKIWFKYQNG